MAGNHSFRFQMENFKLRQQLVTEELEDSFSQSDFQPLDSALDHKEHFLDLKLNDSSTSGNKLELNDSTMECCEGEVDEVDVQFAKAQVKKETFHLRPPVTAVSQMQPPISDDGSSSGDGGNITVNRSSQKKVDNSELVEETEDDFPQINFTGLRHKREGSLKRQNTEPLDETLSYGLDSVTWKKTDELLNYITEGRTPQPKVCCTYIPKYFSHVRNLEPMFKNQKITGTFGEVEIMCDTKTGKQLVKKTLKKNEKGQFSLEKNEIQIPLKMSDARNLAKFCGLVCSDSQLILVMEYAGISLRHLINYNEFLLKLNEPLNLEKVVCNILSGVNCLAKYGITHSDLKPENVCLDMGSWVAKLVDFGSCRTAQDKPTLKGITPEYLDPSLNRIFINAMKGIPLSAGLKLNEKDDVYGVGMITLFLIIRAHPMIYFFTGHFDYPKGPEADNERKLVIEKISQLTNDDIVDLINKLIVGRSPHMSSTAPLPLSETIEEFILNTVTNDRERRWASEKGITFLQEPLLQPVLQPAKKTLKPSSKISEMSDPVVDLKKKNQKFAVTESCHQQMNMTNQLDPCSIHLRQGLGQKSFTASQGVADPSQLGQIVISKKLTNAFQQEQFGAPHFLKASAAKYEQPASNKPSLNYQERKEYLELVQSFNTAPPATTSYNKGAIQFAQQANPPYSRHCPNWCISQKVRRSATQTTSSRNIAVSEASNLPAHLMPAAHQEPSRCLNITPGESNSSDAPPPPLEYLHGNLPHLELIESQDQPQRRIAKAVRRIAKAVHQNRGSHESKYHKE